MIKFYITSCTTLFLGQLIFATIIKAFPSELSVTIKNHDEDIILDWKLTQHDLANHNLPLWHARINSEPELIPEVMNKIGSFAMYHDVDKSSAVVYFQSTGNFFGVIDTRFIIHALPLNAVNPNTYHLVGGPYVKRRDHSMTFHDDLPFSPIFQHENVLSSSILPSLAKSSTSSNHNAQGTCQISSSNNNQDVPVNYAKTHRPGVNIFYAEILVFISNHIIGEFYTLTDLVINYLIYFNSIDMLFAKLAEYSVEIHINIAGLVLEGEENVFHYVFTPDQKRTQQPKVLDAAATLQHFPKYLEKYKNIFVEDSFDFFFLSTHYDMQFKKKNIDGISRMDLDVYKYRTTREYLGTHYDSVGILVQRKWEYADFVTSAHELAHVMKVNHDSDAEGNHCFNLQCYAILQPFGSYCKNCIVWSAKSRKEFQEYVRWNKDRCFLLNQPRSLYPYGSPITTIWPLEQCYCYGLQSYWPENDGNYLEEDTCDSMLTCAIRNAPVAIPFPRPFDGTPCGTNKVCWQRECQNLMNH